MLSGKRCFVDKRNKCRRTRKVRRKSRSLMLVKEKTLAECIVFPFLLCCVRACRCLVKMMKPDCEGSVDVGLTLCLLKNAR